MRITQNTMNYNMRRNIEQRLEDCGKYQGQISSGSKLSRLSDDPVALGKAITMQTALDKQAQYLKNIDNDTAWLVQSETALSSISDIVASAKELAVQAGDAGLGDAELHTLGEEVGQLIDQTVIYANTLMGRSYVFAGYQMDKPVVVNNGTESADENTLLIGDKLCYVNNDLVMREIAPGVTMQVNVSGDNIFNALQTLTDLKEALDNADSSAATDLLDEIDNNFDSLVQQRTVIGVKTKRLDDLKSMMKSQQVDMEDILSNASGVQIEDASIKLAEAQMSYQASLAVTTKLMQVSILDYI